MWLKFAACLNYSLDVEDASTALIEPAPVMASPKKVDTSFYGWISTWTEDGVGLFVALFIFAITLALSTTGGELNSNYAVSSQWPLGAVLVGAAVCYAPHYMLKKTFNIEAYAVVLLVAVTARAIGDYTTLAHSGLTASLWGILIGIGLRTFVGVDLKEKGVVSGEYFVKVGVTLLAMDFTSIVKIGLPGLMVAWGDTLIVLSIGTAIGVYVMQFPVRDAIVVAGATSICGSSAATALSSSLHPKDFKDEVCRTIIALMGLFNAPLMPLMPLLKTLAHVKPAVVGAWIGGSIDSTGQVTASAQMGGDTVLKTAVIVKMAQNILIGPLCLLFTALFQHSFDPNILVSKFPLFVVGFIVTSAVITTILNTDSTPQRLQDNAIDNCWAMSEWLTLLGFACIGLEIDLRAFMSKKNEKQHAVLVTYLFIQSIDIATTFGWAWLMFAHSNISDDGDDDESV